MIDVAWAQAGAGGAGPPPLVQLAPIFLVMIVVYFLLIRPQQQKTKEHEKMLANLKRNDEVITAGGLYGKVVAINEQVVSVEIAPNVRVRVHRPQISTVIAAGRAEDKPKEKDKDK